MVGRSVVTSFPNITRRYFDKLAGVCAPWGRGWILVALGQRGKRPLLGGPWL